MYNYVLLIGSVNKPITKTIASDGREWADIELSVQRPFQNENGEYGNDLIPVKIWAEIVNVDQLEIGDTLGIKCRLSNQDGVIQVIGERVTIIAGKEKPTDYDID